MASLAIDTHPRDRPGKYSVPPSIRALKPKGIPCIVKKINGGFYVYEYSRIDDPMNPGHKKNATGSILGRIVDNRFIPNQNEIIDITDEDPDVLNYGAYALAISCSKDVLPRLEKVYSYKDASTIYTISIIYFVNHYVPARDLQECYIQSYLKLKYTMVSLGENNVGTFLNALGNHAKKRRLFEQGLIDDGSGSYNIDGHVILCCSNNNELADYGSKYAELRNTQTNFMMVFDAKNKRVVACDVFEGGIPDSTAVKDTLHLHLFRKAYFRIDSGFYSEENIGLFRLNKCHFVIAVPGSTLMKKTALKHLSFNNSFIHERMDSHRKSTYSSVQYKEYTVKGLEDIARDDAKTEADHYNEEMKKITPKSVKIKKKYPRKIKSSEYPEDRIIVYKDKLMHDKLVFDYRCSIGDGKHTEEKLEELEPTFGIILLRTNDHKASPEELYIEYKDRWSIETYYDYIRNGVDINALHEENYNVVQGIGFLTIVESLIYSAVQKMIQNAATPYISNMSMDELIRIAGRMKICLHQDGYWYSNVMKGKINELFEYFGVNVKADLKELNSTMWQ